MGKARSQQRRKQKKRTFPTPYNVPRKTETAVANNQVDDATRGPSHTGNIDIVLPPSNTATKHKSIYKHVKNKSQEKLTKQPIGDKYREDNIPENKVKWS